MSSCYCTGICFNWVINFSPSLSESRLKERKGARKREKMKRREAGGREKGKTQRRWTAESKRWVARDRSALGNRHVLISRKCYSLSHKHPADSGGRGRRETSWETRPVLLWKANRQHWMDYGWEVNCMSIYNIMDPYKVEVAIEIGLTILNEVPLLYGIAKKTLKKISHHTVICTK